jgi:hypothetical protein
MKDYKLKQRNLRASHTLGLVKIYMFARRICTFFSFPTKSASTARRGKVRVGLKLRGGVETEAHTCAVTRERTTRRATGHLCFRYLLCRSLGLVIKLRG